MLSLVTSTVLDPSIPAYPGVYLFYNDPETLPVYIGKSICLRKRIQSHFSRAKYDKKEQRWLSNVKYIEWHITAGEVGALLLEAKLIKQKSPLRNRHLKRVQRLYSFTLEQNDNFVQPKLYIQNADLKLQQNCYGLFRSQKEALEFLQKLAEQQSLCRKYLGLEQTQRACFAYQLKRCRGACVGLESPMVHNQRLQAALANYQQRVWPYSGSIGLIEKEARRQDIHVLADWCYLGTVHSEQAAKKLLAGENVAKLFDIDIYKILVRALLSPQRALQVVHLADTQEL